MRLAVFALLTLVPATAATAAEGPAVLGTAPGGASPRLMLYQYLNGEAKKDFAARRATVAGLKTPEAVRDRQRDLKGKFLAALGDLPGKTALNGRVVGTREGEGYRVERVIYESRPGHHVTALFYLPAGAGRFPGVLMPCGHDPNGKAAAAYQRACALLARNGIAAICYDPIGQGERRQVLGADGKPAGAGNTTEHTMADVGARLVGRSVAGYRVWDAIRGLDYLASRPEVDAAKLGCTGCSGGGTITSYLMALDDRVAAAAPSRYVTSLERLFDTIGPQDGEQNVPGQVALGLEHADYLGLRAPRPTLVLASTRDFFDQQGTWASFREAKQLYTRLGHPERVEIIEADEAHGYGQAHREAMARWMLRWLSGKDGAAVEGETRVAGDAELQCTETGQVLSALHGKSVFDLNAERAGELAGLRPKREGGGGREGLLADVRRLIALPRAVKAAGREDRGEAPWGEGRLRKIVFTTEPGVVVPARLYTPARAEPGAPLTVAVGYDVAEGAGLVEGLLAKGGRVLLADLRGMGETAPGGARPGPLGGDVREAFLGFHLGRPLLGQRVADLLAVLAALADEAPAGFALIGRGAAGPVALHAAALEPRVVGLTLEGALTSWAEVVRTPLTKDQLANVVPGALAAYDLPDLAAAFAPRPLTVRGAAGPSGGKAGAEQVEQAYGPARRAYRERGAAGALVVDAGRP